ncbi:MAG: CDP-diacylglycerol--glycerol-3-phosphate 3-phosphatidyltransferase [Synergistaceae bacterium]|nr:CDP-diacylglycerol--glycerol-3-phosphate 3-phosphatidyltransferase [Synergistaceae bacterium]MBP9957876.1 CDP-diacylglycerol--glycerol-3-phosphate 3-phosphatidyltransferase [Synergistaceae bacterium]
MSSALNLPNLISLSRVFLAPVVMVFLAMRGRFDYVFGISLGDLLAGIVFIIASLTDAADGYIARKRGIVTNLGKFIDPLADKILVVAALISLVELQRLPAWMVVIIVSREFIVSGVRMVAASDGIIIAASKGGKIKTVTQIVAICLMIFNVPYIAIPAMWLAMILTVSSGMDYLIKAKDLL